MLTADDGEIIAKKLNAELKKKSRRHKIAIIRINGKEVGRFGIQRGSAELNHNYIHRQLRMSMRDSEEMSACRTGLTEYVEILKASGFYPS
jgi:hypothetical protein